MKKFAVKIIFTFFLMFFNQNYAHAVQFNVLVLPTELFSVCDNYFCFPEPSEILANYVIQDLNSYKNITTPSLSEVRAKLSDKQALKQATEDMLYEFETTEKINFKILKELSSEFDVKSVLLISSYATTDNSTLKRDLWEVLEISNAFNTSYPFKLTTTSVLTDTVNSVAMWSNKFNKTVSNSDGYFLAKNHAQATSQLEKIKQYFRNNISKNISQNVHLRFFPKDVKTFTVRNNNEKQEEPSFMPNALEHLIKPQMIRELENGNSNTYSTDDFIFEF